MASNSRNKQFRERRMGRTWHDSCRLAKTDEHGKIIQGEYIFGGERFDVSPTRGTSFNRVRPQRPALAFAHYCVETGILPDELSLEEVKEPEILEILNQLWEEHQGDQFFMDLTGARGATDSEGPTLESGYTFKVPIDLIVDFQTSQVGRGAVNQAQRQLQPMRQGQGGQATNNKALQAKIAELKKKHAKGKDQDEEGDGGGQKVGAGAQAERRQGQAQKGKGQDEEDMEVTGDAQEDKDREAVEETNPGTAESAHEAQARAERDKQPSQEGPGATSSGRGSAAQAAQSQIRQIADATAAGAGAPEDEEEDDQEVEQDEGGEDAEEATTPVAEKPTAHPQRQQPVQPNRGRQQPGQRQGGRR